MENSELTTGTSGKPMAGIEARLVDWDEGEYKVTDRPKPRGEILLAGEPIAKVPYLNKHHSSLTLDSNGHNLHIISYPNVYHIL